MLELTPLAHTIFWKRQFSYFLYSRRSLQISTTYRSISPFLKSKGICTKNHAIKLPKRMVRWRESNTFSILFGPFIFIITQNYPCGFFVSNMLSTLSIEFLSLFSTHKTFMNLFFKILSLIMHIKAFGCLCYATSIQAYIAKFDFRGWKIYIYRL